MKELEFYFAPFGYVTAVYNDGPNDEYDADAGQNVRSAHVDLTDIKISGDSILKDLSDSAIARGTKEFMAEYEAGE